MRSERTRAEELAQVAAGVVGGPLPVRLRAWDGSEAGAPAGPDTPVVVLRRRRALRHLLWHPGGPGLARAYVLGDLDVEGDLAAGLARVGASVRDRPAERSMPARRRLGRALRTAVRSGGLGPPPRRPVTEARLRGRRHSRRRDRAAISHHYDLSNDFYALLLDSRLTYSCAYWSDDPTQDLEDAQRAKLDLVCRKLDLRPGSRLLDLGCGWGSLTLYAAEERGARVVGLTLSGEQQRLVEMRAKERGLEDRVEVRVQHFADLADDPTVGNMDAAASLEMGEHVGGDDEYRELARLLHDSVRPGGRVLVQQMSRGSVAPGGGAFIESYIAPDMRMRPLPRTLELLAGSGLEVRDVHALREHYPRTVAAWSATLEDRWDDAVALVGEQAARVWRLYLAGGGLAFAENRMGVDQVLLVHPDAAGRSRLPYAPTSWR